MEQPQAETNCPMCGEAIVVGDRFCIGCGTPAEAAETSPPASEVPDELPEVMADAEITTSPSDVPTTPRGRWFRNRWVLGSAVAATCLTIAVAVLVGVVWVPGSVAADPTPRVTTEVVADPVLAGWSGNAEWWAEVTTPAVAISPDGLYLGAARDSRVQIFDSASGDVLLDALFTGETMPGMYSVIVDEESALAAFSESTLRVWVGPDLDAREYELAGNETVSIRGAGQVSVLDGETKDAKVLTDQGLVPFQSPVRGAVPLAPADDGTLLWASARGDIVAATQTGDEVHRIALTAPLEGATIARWVGMIDDLYIVWENADGALVLAAHDPSTGEVRSTIPITTTEATARLVLGTSTAMLGPVRLDGADNMTIPAPEFTANLALGDHGFLGSSDSSLAVLNHHGVLTPSGVLTEIPQGTTATGALVTLGNGVLAVYPPQ